MASYEIVRPVAKQIDDLMVIPTAAAIMRSVDHMVERALVFGGVMATHSADDECVHGGLPSDPAAQPGCAPGCPGYPAALLEGMAVRRCSVCDVHFAQRLKRGRPYSKCERCRS